MSDKLDVKPKSKPKINLKAKLAKSKQKNKFNALTPNKYQKPKEGIAYKDKININNSTVFAPHHNNYNINNNISININIDITNNKPKQMSNSVKNKSQIKTNPISIKKIEFKNNNSLIFNTLKNYTNKNNSKKSPFHIRIKSANMGLNEFKYNSNKSNINNLNKNNNNTKKKFNLTTTAFNPKKEEKNNNKTTIEQKNISIENATMIDNNITSKSNETKKDYTISITNDRLNNDKKLLKNKSNQVKNKFNKNPWKKKSNFSPLINRELLNRKQNNILNYSIGNKKNTNSNYKTVFNDNKYKTLNKNKFIKNKNNLNSKDNTVNLINLINKNQIINNKKKQIMNYKTKSPIYNYKHELKNNKLNNTGKNLRNFHKKDFIEKNHNLENTNFNKTNKSNIHIENKELVNDNKKIYQTNEIPVLRDNNTNLEIKEKENKIEENKKNEKEKLKEEEENIKKKEEEKEKEKEKEKEEEIKKKEEEKQNQIEEQKKKEEEKTKKNKEEKKEKEKGKGKGQEKGKQNKENNKKRILNQSKSQNEIGSDFIKKQLDDKKKEEQNQNQNLNPFEPAIKKLLRMESICKKGFAGPGVKKINQDNFFIYKNFLDSPNHIFMGVCDGHGMFGQDISGYLVNHLPQNLNTSFLKENIKSISSEKDYEKIKNIISLTFVQTNINLVNDDKIDSTFSGTTCSSLLFCPEKIITANVGDSRCVLGKFDGKNWKAKNLTRDHKPNEEDEKKRIIEKGGRIEAYKDEEGDFVGPERVWLKGEDVPGLAMARSFGDDIAHTVGVVSQPEIFEYKLLNEDKFILLASDGIWEFISSDECVNIVKDYYLKNDIDGALNYLYKESSKRWIMEEEVIDDITLIIIFLN